MLEKTLKGLLKMTNTKKHMHIIIAFVLLALGNYGIETLDVGNIAYSFMAITGFSAYFIVFGKEGIKSLFSRPTRFKKYGLLFLLYAQIYGLASGLIITTLSQVMDVKLTANAAQNNPWWFFVLILPIALIGEEIFSITILDILRKKLGFSNILASIITAIIFGLIHYTTYVGSNPLFTVFQILFLQGGARLLLNHVYIKSKSIKTSWFVHYFYDLISFMIGGIG